jgi:hypothetical protein
VGDDRLAVFGQNFPWLKKKCETMRCYDATTSSFVAKVCHEVFAHFHAVGVKRHSSIWNLTVWAARTIFCVTNPHDVKENDEHALDFAFYLSRLFRCP